MTPLPERSTLGEVGFDLTNDGKPDVWYRGPASRVVAGLLLLSFGAGIAACHYFGW